MKLTNLIKLYEASNYDGYSDLIYDAVDVAYKAGGSSQKISSSARSSKNIKDTFRFECVNGGKTIGKFYIRKDCLCYGMGDAGSKSKKAFDEVKKYLISKGFRTTSSSGNDVLVMEFPKLNEAEDIQILNALSKEYSKLMKVRPVYDSWTDEFYKGFSAMYAFGENAVWVWVTFDGSKIRHIQTTIKEKWHNIWSKASKKERDTVNKQNTMARKFLNTANAIMRGVCPADARESKSSNGTLQIWLDDPLKKDDDKKAIDKSIERNKKKIDAILKKEEQKLMELFHKRCDAEEARWNRTHPNLDCPAMILLGLCTCEEFERTFTDFENWEDLKK